MQIHTILVAEKLLFLRSKTDSTMKKKDIIKEMIEANALDKAIDLLNEEIAACPTDDELFFLRGNVFRKMNDWKHAISDYCSEKELNPNSPAAMAYESACQILEFYNKDMYNP